MTERWRQIPGHDGYEASDHGRVRNARTGRVLRPQPHRRHDPYYRVQLGRRVRVYVQRAVLAAFEGERPGYDAMHLDDDTSNNALTNLRWGPPSVNRYNRTSWRRRP